MPAPTGIGVSLLVIAAVFVGTGGLQFAPPQHDHDGFLVRATNNFTALHGYTVSVLGSVGKWTHQAIADVHSCLHSCDVKESCLAATFLLGNESSPHGAGYNNNEGERVCGHYECESCFGLFVARKIPSEGHHNKMIVFLKMKHDWFNIQRQTTTTEAPAKHGRIIEILPRLPLDSVEDVDIN